MTIERSSTFLSQEQIDARLPCVFIFGCGALGATAAFVATRMGVRNFVLIDHDRVAAENIGPQPYSASYLGVRKPLALEESIKIESPWASQADFVDLSSGTERPDFNWGMDPQVLKIPHKIVGAYDLGAQIPQGFYIHEAEAVALLAVDSMEARKYCMEALLRLPIMPGLVIDSRMGLQEMHLLTMRGKPECQEYLKGLEKDEEMVQEPCTARTIAYTPAIVGGWIGRILAAHAREEDYPKEIRSQIAAWNHWTTWRDGSIKAGAEMSAAEATGVGVTTGD